MKLAARALAVLGVAAAAVSPAQAQTRPGFELGPEISYYNYRESGLNITGPMAGIEGSWTWLSPWPLFLRLEATGDASRIDYSSAMTGNTQGIWNFKAEGRVLVGSDLPWQAGARPHPSLAGSGYRALYDMQGSTHTSTGALGYNRLSQYLYLPVGLTLGLPFHGWTVKPNIEADYLIQGWQTSCI